ncbi:YczI family protein [Bacillus sp. JJ664]
MLKLLRMIFGLIAAVLAIWCLITQKWVLMPYMILILGAMFVVIGISEYQLKRKAAAYSNFIVSLFLFSASIQGFILN